MRSGPKTFVVEVGPIEYFASSKDELRRMQQADRRALDESARRAARVGPRSKVVRTRVESNTERRPE